MAKVAVVTDSTSEVTAAECGWNLTVVSLRDEEATSGPEPNGTGPPHFLRKEPPEPGGVATLPTVAAGTLTERFVSTYEELAGRFDAVLSLHGSSRLFGGFEAARAAHAEVRGLVPIEVVDTGLASIALGFVVQRVARSARQGANFAELDLLARQAGQNVHAMFFADSVEYLSRHARWRRARAWPISGNGTRPLLTIEDGEVRPLERVRTRARGYDRLAEFVELFPHVEQLAVLHDAPAADVELLMRRIEPLYPRERITFGRYGPTLREQLGPRALAVFVDQGIGHD